MPISKILEEAKKFKCFEPTRHAHPHQMAEAPDGQYMLASDMRALIQQVEILFQGANADLATIGLKIVPLNPLDKTLEAVHYGPVMAEEKMDETSRQWYTELYHTFIGHVPTPRDPKQITVQCKVCRKEFKPENCENQECPREMAVIK